MITLAALLLLSPVQGVEADPRLAQKVGVHLKIASLSTFVDDLSKKLKVPLKVAQNIGDLKVTAIFNDRPASEAMAKVAELYSYEWIKEGEGYRLICPPVVATEERALVEEEERLERENLQRQLKKWVDSANMPVDGIQRRLEEIQEQLRAARAGEGALTGAQRDKLHQEYAGLFNTVTGRYVGEVLKQLSAQEWQSFWAGTPTFGSTNGDDRVHSLSSDANFDLLRGREPGRTTDPSGALVLLRYKPLTRELDAQIQQIFADGLSGSKLMARAAGLKQEGTERLTENQPLRKRIKAWVSTPAEVAAFERQRFDPQQRKEFPASPYSSGLISVAEQLEWFAESTGTPVIADAFRLPHGPPKAVGGSTYGDWLKVLLSPPSSYGEVGKGYFRTSQDWMMYRHRSFWRKKAMETPERVLAVVERKAEDVGATLQDYADLAQALTPMQAAAFRSPYRVLAKFHVGPIQNTYNALLVYSALSASQKTQASQKGGLTVAQLTPEAKGRYWATITDLLWTSIIFDERTRRALMRGGDEELDRQMLFEVRFQKVSEWPATPSDLAPGGEGQNVFSTLEVAGVTFVMGSPRDPIIFSTALTIPKKK